MHKSFSFSLCTVLVLLLFLSVKAQSVSPEVFENEEDLKDALERKQISYEEYLELLELMSNKVQAGFEEEYKLLVVPGLSWGDLVSEESEKSPLEERGLDFKKKSREGIIGEISWQTCQKPKEKEDFSHQSWVKLKLNQHLRFKGGFSQQGEQGVRIRDRSIEFAPAGTTHLVVGNYDKRFGLGINIGYYSFLNYIRDDSLFAQEQFLYPLRARYNGIFAEQRWSHIKTSFLYSVNRWSEFRNWLLGGDLSWCSKSTDFGMTFSWAKMKRISYSGAYDDRCFSLHLQTKYRTFGIKTEYARMLDAGEGLGLVLLSKGKNHILDWSFWSYSSDFVHLHNGGPSRSDYERIDLEEIEYSYKSRQAGERGVNFISRYKVSPNLRVDFGYSQSSERENLPEKLVAKAGAGYSLSRACSFVLERYWMDNTLELEGLDGEKTSLSLESLPFSRFRCKIIGSYGEKVLTSGRKKYGDLKLKVNSSLFSPFDLSLWLKGYDPDFDVSRDNIWRFYLEEKVKFSADNSFVLGYGFKYDNSKSSTEDKTVTTKLQVSW